MKFREYDALTLDKLHKVELEILIDFINLCERHQLKYFAYAGTGIGVLRHKGFIPWDDDIDVGLLRKDYERFLKYAERELSNKYIIMNCKKDSNYPLMSTRLMKKGTKFREYSLKNIDCELGIFLDIYPFDYVSSDVKQFKKQGRKTWFYSKLLILRSIAFPVISLTGLKKWIIYMMTGLIHILLCCFRISKKWIYRKCENAMMENKMETERVTYFGDTTPYLNIINMRDLFPLKDMPFESITIKMPKNIDIHLKNAYGDYMSLPPVEKRKNHFPYELDFGDTEI